MFTVSSVQMFDLNEFNHQGSNDWNFIPSAIINAILPIYTLNETLSI